MATPSKGKVEVVPVLDAPPSKLKHLVDVVPGLLFRRRHGPLRVPPCPVYLLS
jgi:hypothetical protein